MRSLRAALLVLALLVTVFRPLAGSTPAEAVEQPETAGGFLYYKLPPVVCTGAGLANAIYSRTDCGFVVFASDADAAETDMEVELYGPYDTAPFATLPATYRTTDTAPGRWQFNLRPDATWSAGEIDAVVTLNGSAIGAGRFFLNLLNAQVVVADPPPGSPYRAGDEIPVDITISELQGVATATQRNDVPADFSIEVVRSDLTTFTYGPFTADAAGRFAFTVPSEATSGLSADADSNFKSIISVEVVDAAYTDVATGAWAAKVAGTAPISLVSPPDTLVLRNEFISSRGWVKQGETYPFRVSIQNFFTSPIANATVTIPPVDGTTFIQVKPLLGAGTASIQGGSIVWNVPTVVAGTKDGPAVLQLIVEGRADTTVQDPQLVWKDLSSTAEMTYDGLATPLSSRSLGPHVIPDASTYDSARFGMRPFPVVPVDWNDRKHDDANTGDRISAIINSKDIPGSTANLFSEMSFGQLIPNGAVPSNGIATAGWDVAFESERYADGWDFTNAEPQGTCLGATYEDAGLIDTPFLPDRIRNGWYQMPGDTGYYGTDRYSAVSLGGAVAGVGAVFSIDDACGKTGKAVYDAAHIADPEIDYNEFDTDKDGVVDFFMMLYVGLGGHGDSQINGTPPYDNIWPHSSSLEFYYTDALTGLAGYVSDDRLTDLEGNLQFYVDDTYAVLTDEVTDFPAYVRVGPYNVNPESSVGKASVISHEYGHSLGLPDFYSRGTRETYGSWNLMATDHQQHMDIYGKQEMGWIVPEVLPPGETTVTGWRDSKVDTHAILWQTPDGTPYTLTGPDVHNAQAYTAKLPPKQIIDPAKVADGASPDHVFWSGSGNSFGCAPTGAHNLDIYLPELQDLAPGTPVTLTYNSYFDIEWNYDYGFTMISTDEGSTYSSLPSAKGYTTDSNPNAVACLTQYGNGLHGTSGSYAAGTQQLDSTLDEYVDPVFIEDEYDLTSAAGSETVVRFSYNTDSGLARPGWFIDDVVVTAGDDVIYSSDFEVTHEDGRIFPGGCGENTRVAAACTAGWGRISASEGSPADHGYFLEMRDRSSFDLDGRGQDDRGTGPTFSPGLYLMYTNESRGYGNTGVDGAPAQSPLDSQPQPGNEAPALDDAAFTAVAGDSTFSDAIDDNPWVDNYENPDAEDGLWTFAFECLEFEVLSMSGETVGPALPPYDLVGEVRFNIGNGCSPFQFGHADAGAPSAGAPTAVAQVKSTNVAVGENVAFDGSMSTDDATPSTELTYAWDFGDGETGAGRNVSHAYAAAGTYTVTLTVTDADGLSANDQLVMTVAAAGTPTPGGGPLPTTGGGLVLAGLVALVASGSLRRRTALRTR